MASGGAAERRQDSSNFPPFALAAIRTAVDGEDGEIMVFCRLKIIPSIVPTPLNATAGNAIATQNPDIPSHPSAAASEVIATQSQGFQGTAGISILPRTSIAATTWANWRCRIYFQDSIGNICHAKHDAGTWSGGSGQTVLIEAKLYTPLAVSSWDSGREIHLYYLSKENILQEYCFSPETGWRHGGLNTLKIQADQDTCIAAVQWSSNDIRIYCQEFNSPTVQEYCYGSKWVRGTTLPAALKGSSLAATKWLHNGIHIRVYYQDPELRIREHCWDNHWYIGAFIHGPALPKISITAIAWFRLEVQLRVYLQRSPTDLIELRWYRGWSRPSTVITSILDHICFSAVEWEDGRHVRLYFQGNDRAVAELCCDGGAWFKGAGLIN